MEENNAYLERTLSRSEVDGLSGPVVVDFGTSWCSHCQAAQPAIGAAMAAHPQVRRIKVEDGKGRALGRSFAVKLWPTLIFMRDGKELDRLIRPADAGVVERALALIDGAS